LLLPDRWIKQHPEARVRQRVRESHAAAQRKRTRRARRRALAASPHLLALSDATDRWPIASMLTLRACIVLSSETRAGYNGHVFQAPT